MKECGKKNERNGKEIIKINGRKKMREMKTRDKTNRKR